MKLRSLGEFEDAVDAETAWRRRELTTLLFNVRDSRQSKVQVALRAGIALLYGHWEGWIKSVGELYLSYVDQQRLTYAEMNASLLGGALKSRVNEVVAANASQIHFEFATFLQTGGLDQPARFSKGLIRTEANLSSKVLEDVLVRLGMPQSHYELLTPLIDERLVGARNRIAHGEYLEVDAVQYEDLHHKVDGMLTAFTTDVRNAAATKAYLAPTRPCLLIVGAVVGDQGCEEDSAEVGRGIFVVSGRDSSPLFEPVEAAFDGVALSIESLVERWRSAAG